MKRAQRGQSIVYIVLLLPALLLVLATSIQVALLQASALRLRSALDLASVGGATVVDTDFYARTGRLRLDSRRAATAARDLLARNLAGITFGRSIALSAEITVLNEVPARDPYSGVVVDRPSVCIRARLPVAAGLLRLAGAPPWLILTRTADAELRT